MLKRKQILHFLSSFILLISLVSFSGFTAASTQTQKHQTEIIARTNSVRPYSKQFFFTHTVQQKVRFNQFTVFNFKLFLNKQLLNFNITLKSQKKITLEFFKHPFLKQNLIAQINSSNYKNNFI